MKKIKRMAAATAAMVVAVASLSVAMTSSAAAPVSGAVLVKSDSDDAKALLGISVEDADAEYLLGISSQFNIFLNENFTARGSDCEGRLAIGGSIINETGYSNYQIGNGLQNYGNKTDDLADAIVLGSSFSKIAFSYGHKPYESAPAGESGYDYTTSRIFVVSEDTDVKNGEGNALDLNSENGSKLYYCESSDPIIDFDEEFKNLAETSKTLASYDGVDAVLSNDNKLTLTATDSDVFNIGDGGSDFVAFDITADQYASAKSIYVNVPDDTYVILNISGSSVTTYELNHDGQASYNGEKPCFYFNDTQLENNADEATYIVTNCYEASDVYISSNFLGTLLAPNADVTGTWGHVSGSLIAQSFDGCTEFGYKTCLATIGSTAAASSSSSVPDSSSETNKTNNTSDPSSESTTDESSSTSDDSTASESDSESNDESNSESSDENSSSDGAVDGDESEATSSENTDSTSTGTGTSASTSTSTATSTDTTTGVSTATSSSDDSSPATGSAVGVSVAILAAGLIVVSRKSKK